MTDDDELDDLDFCPCEPMPHMFFRRDSLIVDLGSLEERDPDRDRESFLGGAWSQWAIACPECRRVYADGDATSFKGQT